VIIQIDACNQFEVLSGPFGIQPFFCIILCIICKIVGTLLCIFDTFTCILPFLLMNFNYLFQPSPPVSMLFNWHSYSYQKQQHWMQQYPRGGAGFRRKHGFKDLTIWMSQLILQMSVASIQRKCKLSMSPPRQNVFSMLSFVNLLFLVKLLCDILLSLWTTNIVFIFWWIKKMGLSTFYAVICHFVTQKMGFLNNR